MSLPSSLLFLSKVTSVMLSLFHIYSRNLDAPQLWWVSGQSRWPHRWPPQPAIGQPPGSDGRRHPCQITIYEVLRAACHEYLQLYVHIHAHTLASAEVISSMRGNCAR
jgi:hypothetical protein